MKDVQTAGDECRTALRIYPVGDVSELPRHFSVTYRGQQAFSAAESQALTRRSACSLLPRSLAQAPPTSAHPSLASPLATPILACHPIAS